MMRTKIKTIVGIITLLIASRIPITAQQFNSDNYLAMPHGMSTFCITSGTEYQAIIPSFSLFEKWEFFVGAFLYNEKPDREMSGKYTTTFWVKRMMYENKTQDAGWCLAGGTGTYPGYTHPNPDAHIFRSIWFSPMFTVRLLNGHLYWDSNPGIVMNTDYGNIDGNVRWGFQYSTRLAVYGIIPQSAVVGEVFGTAGGAYVVPQYRVGVRWEHMPKIGGLTASWSQAFDGSPSGGFEIGILLFTPRFACFKGCDNTY